MATTMTAVNEPVGISNPAYAVGRAEILDWLNSSLRLKLSKVEETANGAVACQVMDALFPGQVAMARVDWGARSEYEMVGNYKVLQAAFERVKVQRAMDVPALIKGTPMMNLEWLQWLKKFYENNAGVHCNPADYDAVARRALGKNVGVFKWHGKAAVGGGASGAGGAARAPPTTRISIRSPEQAPKPKTTSVAATLAAPSTKQPEKEKENAKSSPPHVNASTELAHLRAELDALRMSSAMESRAATEIAVELRAKLADAERTRDAALARLHEVETLVLSADFAAGTPQRKLADSIVAILRDVDFVDDQEVEQEHAGNEHDNDHEPEEFHETSGEVDDSEDVVAPGPPEGGLVDQSLL